jgi:hypothetical protein
MVRVRGWRKAAIQGRHERRLRNSIQELFNPVPFAPGRMKLNSCQFRPSDVEKSLPSTFEWILKTKADLMSLKDGKIRVLTKLFGGQGTINVPSWSPDGQKLAFVSYEQLPAESLNPE